MKRRCSRSIHALNEFSLVGLWSQRRLDGRLAVWCAIEQNAIGRVQQPSFRVLICVSPRLACGSHTPHLINVPPLRASRSPLPVECPEFTLKSLFRLAQNEFLHRIDAFDRFLPRSFSRSLVCLIPCPPPRLSHTHCSIVCVLFYFV